MSRRQGPLADTSTQDKLRNRERVAQAQYRADVQEIVSSPAGRRFLYNLIFAKCGLMNIYPLQDSGVYRHEGRRSIGLEFAAELQEEFPEAWTLMIEEHLTTQRNDAVIRKAALAAGESDG